MTDEVRTARLNEITALGPFFAVQAHEPDSAVREPWRPLIDLVDDPTALRARVAMIRSYLASTAGCPPDAVEPRVAASVTHLGLVARLVSPVLALLAVDGIAAIPSLDRTRWQPRAGSAFPLSLELAPGVDGRLPGCEAGSTAVDWAAGVVQGPLADLVEVTCALSVSRRVLWGNIASAVASAAGALAVAAPAHTSRARDLADLLLAQPQLRDSGIWTRAAGTFRRRSCCLIYRVGPRASRSVCGDCVLARDQR